VRFRGTFPFFGSLPAQGVISVAEVNRQGLGLRFASLMKMGRTKTCVSRGHKTLSPNPAQPNSSRSRVLGEVMEL